MSERRIDRARTERPASRRRQPGQQKQGVLRDGEAFLFRNETKAGRDVGRGDPDEIEPLTAGENGGGQLMHLGGGENKDHMRRRLFKGFEQGVESPG